MPHLPDLPSSAQYHTRTNTQSLSTTIVQARSQLSPTISSPTLFSAQQGVIHPIFTAQGLTTTFAHSPPLHDSDGDEAQVCLWDNCGREFPSLAVLVSHLDRDHTLTMVKFVCLWKECQRGLKPFDARYKLITHLRCHTGEKPYRCEVSHCARSFSRLENLKLHVRTHTGEKPYTCHYDGCNKRFNNTSDRAKHMKTHITRKPYACKYPGCGKSYTDPSSMRKHVKFAHKLREKDAVGVNPRGASIVAPRQSSRKQSSSSSSSTSPSTPHTPTTGITMFIPRTSLNSPTPLTIGNTSSPQRIPQTAVYIQSPLVTPGNNNNNNPGGVITMTPPTSSLITVPVSAMVQPQMVGMAVQSSSGGQPLFIQSGNPQQPFLVVLPSGGVGSASNGNFAMGSGTVRQLQSYGSKVSLQGSLPQQGLAEPMAVTAGPRPTDSGYNQVQLLLDNGLLQRDKAAEESVELVQVVRNSPGDVVGGDTEGAAIEEELQMKIAHLQHQLRLHQSRAKQAESCQTGQMRAEMNHVGSGSMNLVSSATNSPPPQYQLTYSTAQLMGGTSPAKVAIVSSSSSACPSPPIHGQIVALPANANSSQLPLAIQAARNLLPAQYLHPATGARISVLPSSRTVGPYPSHSPAGAVVNSSQQILGMSSGEQAVLPQFMFPANPMGAQLLPISVLQPPGVVAPQILQLAPALHVDGK